jgi:hypothetical protein
MIAAGVWVYQNPSRELLSSDVAPCPPRPPTNAANPPVNCLSDQYKQNRHVGLVATLASLGAFTIVVPFLSW